MAERMGFEPMVRSRESLVFKTSSINHSDTSPQWLRQNAGIIIQKYGGVVNPSAQTFLKIISHVNLTVNFLLRFAQMFFVLDSSAIRNAKTAAVLHLGGKIFGDYFTAHRG